MFAQVIIWKNRFESQNAFLRSLTDDQKELTVVLSPEQNEQYPDDENDSSHWVETIIGLEQKFARLAARHNEAVEIIIHVLLGKDVDEHTYEMLSKICEASKTRGHKVHIVWTCDKYSENEAGEQAFFLCAKKTIENYARYTEEIAQADVEIDNELQRRIDRLPEEIPNVYNNHAVFVYRRNQLIQKFAELREQKHRELENKHLKIHWNRMSVLFDTSNIGANDEKILKLRSAAVAGAIFSAKSMSGEYELYCYSIKKTPYSQEEYGMIPAYCLYDNILRHPEDIAAVRRIIMPDFDLTLSDFVCTDIDILTQALLADDDNYPARNAKELVKSFLEFNPVYNVEGVALEKIRKSVDNWKKKVKTALAQWVDLDQSIIDFLSPDGDFEEELEFECPKCSVEDVIGGNERFGVTVPLSERISSAKGIAGKMCTYLDKAIKKRYYKEVISSLEDVSTFMKKIKEINAKEFDPYGKMRALLGFRTPWQVALQNNAGIWFNNQGMPENDTIEDYSQWLEGVLARKKDDLIRECGAGNYAAFSRDQLDHASETPLISNAHCHALEAEKEFAYDGYLCKIRAYILDSCNDVTELFVHAQREENIIPVNAGGEEITQESTEEYETKEITRMQVDQNTFSAEQQKNGEILIRFNWPEHATELRIEMEDAEGRSIALKERITNGPPRKMRHEFAFNLRQITPGNKTFRLAASGGANVGQIIGTADLEIRPPLFKANKVELDKPSFADKVKMLFAKKTGYLQGTVKKGDLQGLDQDAFLIRMSIRGHSFDYRYQSERRILVKESSFDAARVQIIYKGE